jgi:hypothetical protein
MAAVDPNSFAGTSAEATEDESLNQAAGSTAHDTLVARLGDLETTNHRLRAENLTLRARIDRLKFKHSFERKFHLVSGGLLLVLLLLTIGLAFYVASVR